MGSAALPLELIFRLLFLQSQKLRPWTERGRFLCTTSLVRKSWATYSQQILWDTLKLDREAVAKRFLLSGTGDFPRPTYRTRILQLGRYPFDMEVTFDTAVEVMKVCRGVQQLNLFGVNNAEASLLGTSSLQGVFAFRLSDRPSFG